MKQFSHKTTSMLMALVVLFSTMSFTINMHYCGGTLVDTALFGNAKSCCMDIQKATQSEDSSVTKKNCCDEEHKVIEGQDELQLTLDSFTFDQQLVVASFIYSYINLFEGLDNKIIPFKDYHLPLVDKDIQVLYQTFLI